MPSRGNRGGKGVQVSQGDRDPVASRALITLARLAYPFLGSRKAPADRAHAVSVELRAAGSVLEQEAVGKTVTVAPGQQRLDGRA